MLDNQQKYQRAGYQLDQAHRSMVSDAMTFPFNSLAVVRNQSKNSAAKPVRRPAVGSDFVRTILTILLIPCGFLQALEGLAYIITP
jgi:hypothetical protein